MSWFAHDLEDSGSRTSLKLPDPDRDEVVKYAWDTLWQGLVDHVIDKQYYPRYIGFAVATTVAQVSLSNVLHLIMLCQCGYDQILVIYVVKAKEIS